MTLPHTPSQCPLRTRADVQALVHRLVAPIQPHFSPARARVRLGPGHAWYGEPADLLEGFARPLWGLVPLVAGGGKADLTCWQQGLIAGTDPEHPEFWGWAGDFDQRIVEMAPIALGLLLLPDPFWEGLPPAVRTNVAAWLSRVNAVRPVDSNWLFFRILVNLALCRRGVAWSAENVALDLARVDAFHQEHGWYSDGLPSTTLRDGRVGDYYVPMGMHFYGLLVATLAPDLDPARTDAFRLRAREFATDFAHWFAADGAALPFGRSLTYRFAQGAFWGAMAYAGIESFPWGVLKGLYLRHLRWWAQRPILTESGLLTVGYAYPNLFPAESYNGPGSPYWALKAFLPLALPDSHPFWTAAEEPLPRRKSIHTVPSAGLVMMAPADGDVVALNAGQRVGDWPRHAAHKYSKFAYSTGFGFCVPVGTPTLAEGGFDSVLAVSDDERWFRHRDYCVGASVEDGVAFSRWQPFPKVEVSTWLLADVGCHLRVHRVHAELPIWTADCGFAAGYDAPNTIQRAKSRGRIEVTTPLGWSGILDVQAESDPELVEVGVNSNLLHPLAIMPVLRRALRRGSYWLVSVVYGATDANSVMVQIPRFEVLGDDTGCGIRRNGTEWWWTSNRPCGRSAPARREFVERLIT